MKDKKKDLAAALSFIDGLVRRIDRKRVYPRSTVYTDIVLLALLSKSLRVGRAVCALVEAGYGEEAFGLTRTLIDIFLTAHFISNKDEAKRAEQYAKFTFKEKEAWLSIVEKYFAGAFLADERLRKEILKEAKPFPNPHWWTGPGHTKRLAQEPDTREFDANGNPLTCEFDYEVLYKWTSQYVHCTASSLDSHLAREFGVFKTMRRDQRLRFDDLALLNALTYSLKVAITVSRYLGVPLSKRTGNRFQDIVRRNLIPAPRGF